MLVDSVVKNVKPKDKNYKLSDRDGLYLLVIKAGKKYWRWDYRYKGKRNTASYGAYPKTSLKQARELLLVDKDVLSQGFDPNQQKQLTKIKNEQSIENTFSSISDDFFEVKKGEWKPVTYKTEKRRLELHLFPYIGNLPVYDIEPPILIHALRKLSKKGSHETVKRVRRVASLIFRHGIALGICVRDPAHDIASAFTKPKPKGFSYLKKPSEVGQLLRAMGGGSNL